MSATAREPDNRAARRREANRQMRTFLERFAIAAPVVESRDAAGVYECLFCPADLTLFSGAGAHASDCLYRECVSWLKAHAQSDSSSPAPTRTTP